MGGVDCVEWTPGLCGNYSVYFAMQAFTCVINAENLANKMGQLCHGVNKNHWIDRRQNDRFVGLSVCHCRRLSILLTSFVNTIHV